MWLGWWLEVDRHCATYDLDALRCEKHECRGIIGAYWDVPAVLQVYQGTWSWWWHLQGWRGKEYSSGTSAPSCLCDDLSVVLDVHVVGYRPEIQEVIPLQPLERVLQPIQWVLRGLGLVRIRVREFAIVLGC